MKEMAKRKIITQTITDPKQLKAVRIVLKDNIKDMSKEISRIIKMKKHYEAMIETIDTLGRYVQRY